jgi:hypothetical protein
MSRMRRGWPDDIEATLASLGAMRVAGLRQFWKAAFGEVAPPCQSAHLLRRLIAWRLQEARFGGLPADAKRRLRNLRSPEGESPKRGAALPLVLKPGTMITREWRGGIQRVHVLEDGFAYEGRRYASLSVIARLITGKRWSGPRFFGVEKGKARPDNGLGRRAGEG